MTSTQASSTLQIIERTERYWGTPLYRHQITDADDLNEQLSDLIHQRRADALSTTMGIFEGEKSHYDLLTWDHPAIHHLRDHFLAAAHAMNDRIGVPADAEDNMIAEAWAVTYEQGGHHALHSHPGSAWSGVYYINTGRPGEHAGAVEFCDPRAAACAREPHRDPLLSIEPDPGLLIMFPSWLVHWVTPHKAFTNRLCVAANIGFSA